MLILPRALILSAAKDPVKRTEVRWSNGILRSLALPQNERLVRHPAPFLRITRQPLPSHQGCRQVAGAAVGEKDGDAFAEKLLP